MATKAIADKELYSELTDKQQSVVDAKVNNPDASHVEIAEIADAHNTYVGPVLDRYEHIVEERSAMQNNSHERSNANGNVSVEGEIDLTDAPGEQHISDRPHTDDSADESDETDDPYRVNIDDATLADRIDDIRSEITPDWMDRDATTEETVRYLARFYHGEV